MYLFNKREVRGRVLLAFLQCLLLASVVVAVQGCHRKTTIVNVPTGVSQRQVTDWYTATGAMKTIGDETQKITQACIQGRQAFPDEASYQATLEALGKVAQTGIIVSQALAQQPQNFNKPLADQIAPDIGAVNDAFTEASKAGLTKITNPTLAAELQLSVTLIQGGIQTIRTAIAAEGGQ